MTIDERLERLTERHEALTQSVELMALENRERDRRQAEIMEGLAAENRERDRRQAEIMEGLASLVHVAEIHEHRIERLEDAG
jgi:hypothetical protein